MAQLQYLDRKGDQFAVTRETLSGPRVKMFATRAEAEAYAAANMNRRNGQIISTLDMTPEQLAAHQEREARIRAAMKTMFAN